MHQDSIEHRSAALYVGRGGPQLRSAPGGLIVGYAAVFNRLSVDLGGFREFIRPGAFSRAIRDRHDAIANVDHDNGRLLGRVSAGTLRLSEDRTGLRIEIDPPDTQLGRDMRVLIARGDVTKMSFSFRPKTQEWTRSASGGDLRELIDVDLRDCAVLCERPAYEDTSVNLRRAEGRRLFPIAEVAMLERHRDADVFRRLAAEPAHTFPRNARGTRSGFRH